MAESTLGQRISDNPILAAARSNSTPAPTPAAPLVEIPGSALSITTILPGGAPTPIPQAMLPPVAGSAPASITPTPSPIVPTTAAGASQSNSTSNSVSISTTVVTKPEPGSTTDDYVNQITAGIEEGKKFTVQQNNLINAAARKTQNLADIQGDIADNVAVIALQKDTAQLEAQTNSLELFNIGGGVDKQAKLTAARDLQEDRVMETQQVVSDLVNDDSLLGIVKQFLFKGDAVEEANVAEAGLNKIRDIQTKALGLASQTDQTLEDLQVTQSWATLDANQKLINLKGLESQLKYAANADLLHATEFDNAIKMTNKEVQSVQAKWGMLQQDKVFKATQAERARLSNAAMKDRRVMEAVVATSLNGMKLIGLPIYEGDDPVLQEEQNVQIEAALSLAGANRDKMLTMFELGSGRVAPTKFQAFTGLSVANSEELKVDKNPSANILADAWGELQAEASDPNKGFKLTQDNAATLFNNKVVAKLAAYEKEIVPGVADNPNQAQPMSWLVQQPGLKDMPLVRVIGSLFDDPNASRDMSPSKLAEIGFSHVKTKNNPEGTLTFDEVINGANAIYAKVAVLNTAKQNRLNLGFAPQTTYNTKIKGLTPLSGFVSSTRFEGAQAFAGSGAVINMMDKTQLRLLGVRMLAGQALPKRLEDVGLDPTLADAAGLPPRKEKGFILDFLTGGDK